MPSDTLTPTPTATATPTPTFTYTPTLTPTDEPTPTATPLPSLRGYWTLDQVSGQRLDSSGQGNHLADNNTVGSTAGQIGLAADFESDNSEYLSISDAAQNGLDITDSLTLVGWMNVERLKHWQIMVAKYEYSVNNCAYRLGLRPGNRIGFIVSPDGSFSNEYLLEASPPFTLGPGTWYHVAGVFDAQQRTLSVYFDGELIAARSVSYDTVYNSSAPFMLGANLRNGNVTQYFDGQLDEWRVYSRALTEGEIEDLMAPPTQVLALTPTSTPTPMDEPAATETPLPGLQGYWTLDQASDMSWAGLFLSARLWP
jgi:hypothetical protein